MCGARRKGAADWTRRVHRLLPHVLKVSCEAPRHPPEELIQPSSAAARTHAPRTSSRVIYTPVCARPFSTRLWLRLRLSRSSRSVMWYGGSSSSGMMISAPNSFCAATAGSTAHTAMQSNERCQHTLAECRHGVQVRASAQKG